MTEIVMVCSMAEGCKKVECPHIKPHMETYRDCFHGICGVHDMNIKCVKYSIRDERKKKLDKLQLERI